MNKEKKKNIIKLCLSWQKLEFSANHKHDQASSSPDIVTALSLSIKCYPLSFLSVSYVKIAKLLNHIIIPTFIHDPVQQNLPMQAQIT